MQFLIDLAGILTLTLVPATILMVWVASLRPRARSRALIVIGVLSASGIVLLVLYAPPARSEMPANTPLGSLAPDPQAHNVYVADYGDGLNVSPGYGHWPDYSYITSVATPLDPLSHTGSRTMYIRMMTGEHVNPDRPELRWLNYGGYAWFAASGPPPPDTGYLDLAVRRDCIMLIGALDLELANLMPGETVEVQFLPILVDAYPDVLSLTADSEGVVQFEIPAGQWAGLMLVRPEAVPAFSRKGHAILAFVVAMSATLATHRRAL